jgi:hypothetical protein
MPDSPELIAERMLVEGRKTLEFFRSLTPEQWESTIYTEGSVWRLRDVLAHFVSAELGMLRLVESILSGGQGTPDDFDLNAYNERKVAGLKDTPIEVLLEQFSNARQRSVALVQTVSAADLAKNGRHPWLGIAPIADILKMMYRHNQIHQREIRRILHPGGRGEDE